MSKKEGKKAEKRAAARAKVNTSSQLGIIKMGEIALALVRYRIDEKGLSLRPSRNKRNVRRLAKQLGLSVADVNEFFRVLALELVAKSFGK